jgi:predicted TPR repeat methyltransferase
MLRRWLRAASRTGLFGRPGLLLAMADRARDNKRWAEAAALYRVYLALRPRAPAIWVQFGHMLKESGQIVEAETAYRQSLMLQPDSADAYLHLGHLLKISGHATEAAKAYGSLLGAYSLNQTARSPFMDQTSARQASRRSFSTFPILYPIFTMHACPPAFSACRWRSSPPY